MKLEMFVTSPPQSYPDAPDARGMITRVEAMIRPWAIVGNSADAYRALRKSLREAIEFCESQMRKQDLECDFEHENNFNGTYPVPAKVIAMCAKRMLEMALDMHSPSSSIPFYHVARDVEMLARMVGKLIPEKIKE